MLRSVRVHPFPTLDAAFEVHAAVQADLRVHATYARRMIADDALLVPRFPRHGRERGFATVILEGRALVRAGAVERWVGPGEGFHLATKDALLLRCEAAPVYRSLVVDLSFADPRELVVQADPASTLAAARLWDELRAGPGSPTASVAAYLEQLTRHVPFSVPALVDDAPPRLVALNDVLEAQLSDLSARPMMVDLEQHLGRSPRQLSRLVRELHQRYGFNADGWIDARHRRRLMMAAALLSDPTRRVAAVAGAVGYTSPQAMARAFARAGLPAPRDVARAIAALVSPRS